jgi:hypothetical protein
MTQDELKTQVGQAALHYVEPGSIVGVWSIMRVHPLSLLSFLMIMSSVLSSAEEKPHIAPFLNNCSAAFSLTFDDGWKKEVEDAVGVINPLGHRNKSAFPIRSRWRNCALLGTIDSGKDV